jgi:hypothetical protein
MLERSEKCWTITGQNENCSGDIVNSRWGMDLGCRFSPTVNVVVREGAKRDGVLRLLARIEETIRGMPEVVIEPDPEHGSLPF